MVEFESLLWYRQVMLTSLSRALHNSQKSSVNYDWTMTNTSQFSEIFCQLWLDYDQYFTILRNYKWLAFSRRISTWDDWTLIGLDPCPLRGTLKIIMPWFRKMWRTWHLQFFLQFLMRLGKNRILTHSHPIEDVNVLHDDLCDKKIVSLKPATSAKNNEIGNFRI